MTDTKAVRLPIREPWEPADLSRPHLIGMAGAGMSALASVLIGQGARVSGSDRNQSQRLSALAAAGATTHIGHDAAHVAGASCVIVSTAVPEDNVELLAARRRGIPVLHRAQALAQLMAGNPDSALVTGTHGKTTTTAMVAHILRQAGDDPTYVIGADWTFPATGGYHGSGRFVAEADESDRSFRWLRADLAVITGIEDDHPEQYATAEEFAAEVSAWLRDMPGTTVVANADDPLTLRATDVPGVKLITYGTAPDAKVRILRIDLDKDTSHTTVRLPDGEMVKIRLSVPGRAMAHNAVAALAAALALGIGASAAAAALPFYQPVRRRLTVHGEASGVTLADSFAHHPSAIAADLEALAELRGLGGRVLVAFQPSGHRRAATLGEQMGKALTAADHVTLLPINDPCNSFVPGTTTRAITAGITDAISDRNGQVESAGTVDEASRMLLAKVRPGDVVVTMGTGDVTELGAQLLGALSPATLPAELVVHQ
ncbi:UDP-N-acetylmuramate--L-alanine ligase [Actinoallomurus sp. NPDC052274]|uniref:UDP-N-acetylmuramate--L-alanine ligase n=1 Tax=Actinoallomurus sp. NPDC052274 TaxID=3155420 RepID=UPI0034332AE5